MPSNPRTIALIATRFRAQLLARLLGSLDQQTLRLTGAVVCDNGPDPATVQATQDSPLPCELVSPGRNLGFGGGLAFAAEKALFRFPDLTHFLVLDDDAILSQRTLESLLASGAKNSAGSIAPFLVDEGGTLQEFPEPVSWRLARAFRANGQNLEKARVLAPHGYPMAWCLGPCLLVDRETWQRAGPPRSDMLAYGDDVEFSLRLSAAAPAWADSSVTVIHAPPNSISRLPTSTDADHFKKFGTLLQNLAFTCVASPRPRHLPLYLKGTARRFLLTFGFTSANFTEVARRYLKGFAGIPGGR